MIQWTCKMIILDAIKSGGNVMRKYGLLFVMLFVLVIVSACGGKDTGNGEMENALIEVDFQIAETAQVGEAVELKAIVTHLDEPVKDANQMEFEIWLEDDSDNSVFMDGENNGDGTYTLLYTFDEAGVYEIYAHTTARDSHDMPKKSITITE